MMAPMRRRPLLVLLVALALLTGALLAMAPTIAPAADTPRRGGVLLAVIGADPPSLDPHQESTFANIELVAPLYSTLLQLDPYAYPKIIGDLATEWKISPDGLTYTFKIHPGVKFHDGSPLTAADVKASYDKIIFPPQGVRSVRKNAYTAVSAVEAPDATTVVFKLKFPSASLLANLASPWNVIFPKKYLDQDPNYFKTHVIGSGPFKFKAYTRGSTFEGERNPSYFVKDRPYLDGYKFYISPETSVRAAAIRSGRAYIEFRNLPDAEVDAIKKQLGDKVTVQETAMTGQWGVAINNTKKPFDDVRVRQALTLAIDRYTMGKVLAPLTGLKFVGGLMRPGSEWGMPPAELEKLAALRPVPERQAPKQQPKRGPLPAHLPRVDVRHEPEQTICQCGRALKRIGEDVSEKLDYTPGVFQVERHIRGKWACTTCQTLLQAPVPAEVIDKGIPTAGLLAQVLVAKYADH